MDTGSRPIRNAKPSLVGRESQQYQQAILEKKAAEKAKREARKARILQQAQTMANNSNVAMGLLPEFTERVNALDEESESFDDDLAGLCDTMEKLCTVGSASASADMDMGGRKRRRHGKKTHKKHHKKHHKKTHKRRH